MLAAALFLATLIPGAEPFHDAKAGLSIELGGLQGPVCITHPPPAEPAPGCEGIVPPPLPSVGKGRVLAIAFLLDPRGDVSLTLLELPFPGAHVIPDEEVQPAIEGIAKGAAKSFGARVDVYGRQPGQPHVRTIVRDVPVIEYTLAPQGAPPIVTWAIVGVNKLTVLSMSGPAAMEKDTLAAGDAMIRTLVAPAEGVGEFGLPRGYFKGKRIGRAAAPFACIGLFAAAVVAMLFFVRRRRRAQGRASRS